MSDVRMNLKTQLNLPTVKTTEGVEVLDKKAPFPSVIEISTALLTFAKGVLPSMLGSTGTKFTADFLTSFGNALENRLKAPGGRALNEGSQVGKLANDVYDQAVQLKLDTGHLGKVFDGLNRAIEVKELQTSTLKVVEKQQRADALKELQASLDGISPQKTSQTTTAPAQIKSALAGDAERKAELKKMQQMLDQVSGGQQQQVIEVPLARSDRSNKAIPSNITDAKLRDLGLMRLPDGTAMLEGMGGDDLGKLRQKAQALANTLGGTVQLLGSGMEAFHPKA